jgi:hypothetical protein
MWPRLAHKLTHNSPTSSARPGSTTTAAGYPARPVARYASAYGPSGCGRRNNRAELLDGAFADAQVRTGTDMGDAADLNAILRSELADSLKDDLRMRTDRVPHTAVYAHWWERGDPETAQEADLQAIRDARASLARDLATNNPDDMLEDAARRLLTLHGLSEEMLRPLMLGLMETGIRRWDMAERRTLGRASLVFDPTPPPAAPPAAPVPPAAPPPGPAGPLASTLVDLFRAWGLASKGFRKGGAGQAAATSGCSLR